MRGDGITGIFGGIDGYFLPGPLRTISTKIIFNHPYISVLTFYSIFHPLSSTKYLNIALISATHISAICTILLSMRIFVLSQGKKLFLFLMIVAVFNWASFYDGVLQGFPPEFIEVFCITFGFYLLLRGNVILAGLAFGAASTLKVLPVIFLPYFIYKKQYRLVLSAVMTGLLFTGIILWKENLNWNLVNSIIDSMGKNAAYEQNIRDAGLSAFIYFVFHRALNPFSLTSIHLVACALLALFFISIERLILSERNKYLFGLAAGSLAMFQISPHCTEMYWYILLLPAIIFNIWMLLIYRDKLFGVIFVLSHIFLHGFSLLNIIFRIFAFITKGSILYTDIFSFFNKHGGVFIGTWLLYFSTYGFALKYLIPIKKRE
jgi:energy-converting hydrogenase Eha subunit C